MVCARAVIGVHRQRHGDKASSDLASLAAADGVTPLHLACASSGATELVQLLVGHGARPDAQAAADGATPLLLAARLGHTADVTLLLQARASVLARTQGGATPLMRAAFAGHADVCTLLLRAGSAAEAQDADGETAAHKAAAQRQDATLAVLLKAAPGAAELRNRHSKTPSELRAERG